MVFDFSADNLPPVEYQDLFISVSQQMFQLRFSAAGGGGAGGGRDKALAQGSLAKDHPQEGAPSILLLGYLLVLDSLMIQVARQSSRSEPRHDMGLGWSVLDIRVCYKQYINRCNDNIMDSHGWIQYAIAISSRRL